ncbi:hypothetical protein ACHWQZ_G004439 [Mnemiopsis leidyi]
MFLLRFAMEEVTVLIKLKTEEQLVVPKDRLVSNSPVFRHLLVDLNFEEHVIDDFSPESVKQFLALLENGSLGDIDDYMFRELHKLGNAFKVGWLRDSCRDWLRNKMESASSKEDKLYLFEESWFIADKLKDKEVMDDLVEVLAHKDNSPLLTHYLSDMSKLEESQIDVLLRLGGGNVELFLNIILQNLRGQTTLCPKLKYILDNMNLALCCEINEGLYLEVMDIIPELSEITLDDLRWAHKLVTSTVKLVRSRTERRRNAKLTRTTVLREKQKYLKLFRRLRTVTDLMDAVATDCVTSMFDVIDFLLRVFIKENVSSEEQQIFIANLAEVCSNKKLQKVSRNYLQTIISALNYSNLEQAQLLITILTKIKNNEALCSNSENVVTKSHKTITVRKKGKFKYLFECRHPLSAACKKSMRTWQGNQITVTGVVSWWKYWLSHIKDWKATGVIVAYNVSDHLIAKRK